jgi:hypothetical protein
VAGGAAASGEASSFFSGTAGTTGAGAGALATTGLTGGRSLSIKRQAALAMAPIATTPATPAMSTGFVNWIMAALCSPAFVKLLSIHVAKCESSGTGGGASGLTPPRNGREGPHG